jgi:YVTN family beta-propeller protein
VNVGTSPHSLAYDSAKGLIYANGVDEVVVISDSTNKVTATLNTGFNGPKGIICDSGKGEIFVANSDLHDGNETVSVISDSTNTVIATVNFEQQLGSLAYDPGSGQVYVTCPYDKTVAVLSDSTNSVAANISVGWTPDLLAYDSAKNEVFVTNPDVGTVQVISVSASATSPMLPENNTLVFMLTGSAIVTLALCAVALSARKSNKFPDSTKTC